MNIKINKLVEITLDWNDNEEHMGENAALEAACEINGVDSQWYYNNMAIYSDIVNERLKRIYEYEKEQEKKETKNS